MLSVAASFALSIAGIAQQATPSANAHLGERPPNDCLRNWGLRTLLGESVRAFDDVDGDGVDDVLAAVRDDNSGELGFGYCLSGADGSVLWRFDRRRRAGRLVPVPDLDGDGIREVAAEFEATLAKDWCDPSPPAERSTIRFVSGADGSLVRERPWPIFEPKPRWGPVFCLVGLGDRNRDGVGDYGLAFAGGLSVHSGSNDEPLTAFGSLVPNEGVRRMESVVVGDVDRDGVDDVVLGVVPYRNEMSCSLLSVGRGAVLGRFLGSGSRLASIGDVDGDDVPDWVASDAVLGRGEWFAHEASELVAVSGATLSAIWRRPRPAEFEAAWFGAALASVPDVDGDDVRDLVVGSVSWTGPPPPGLLIVSGASGAVLRSLQLLDELVVGSSLAVLEDGGLVVGGGWMMDNPFAETEGYVAVLEPSGELRWIVRGSTLKAEREEARRVRIELTLTRLDHVSGALFDELVDGALFRGPRRGWVLRANGPEIERREARRARIERAIDLLESVNRQLVNELLDGTLFEGR